MIQISSNALVRFIERTGLASFDPVRAGLTESLERARRSAADLGSDSFTVIADGLKYIVEDGVLVTVLEHRGRRRR